MTKALSDRIVILGGGTGGTLTANRLRRQLGHSAQITVVDRDDRYIYQPGLLFVPFGLADPEEIVRSESAGAGAASCVPFAPCRRCGAGGGRPIAECGRPPAP